MPKLLPLEEWRRVPGYPAYEVSNYGRIRSYWKRVYVRGVSGCHMEIGDTPTLVKPGFDGTRVGVTLRDSDDDHKDRGVGLAHLILEVFDRPAMPGEMARHITDPNPQNCVLWNLGWGTSEQNHADVTRHHGKHHNAKLTAEQVREIRKRLAYGELQETLAKEFGVRQGAISKIKLGKTGKTVKD